MLLCKIKHARMNAFAVLIAHECCMKSTKTPKVTYSELRTTVFFLKKPTVLLSKTSQIRSAMTVTLRGKSDEHATGQQLIQYIQIIFKDELEKPAVADPVTVDLISLTEGNQNAEVSNKKISIVLKNKQTPKPKPIQN